jgi:hypothetical protein
MKHTPARFQPYTTTRKLPPSPPPQEAPSNTSLILQPVDDGGGEGQLVEQAPAPPPDFRWNISQPNLTVDWIRKAFFDMELMERVDMPCSGSVLNFRVDGMINVDALVRAFANKVMNVEACSDIYLRAVKDARAFNFVVVGSAGNGKRTVINRACIHTNIGKLTISLNSYIRGYLILAIEYSIWNRPFLIYIDDFTELCENPDFVDEYKRACNYVHISKTWNHVWLVLSMSSITSTSKALAQRVCWDQNYVRIGVADSLVLVKFLTDSLVHQHIAISPRLTPTQWNNLKLAVSGASFHDVETFACRIANMAIEAVPIASLLSKSRTEAAQSLVANNQQAIAAEPYNSSSPLDNPPPTLPMFPSIGELNTLITGVQSSNTSVGPRAAATLTENAHAFATISWVDVETLYVPEEATAETEYSRMVIPKDVIPI